jgi:uncharacterized Zn-finger protein
MMSQASPASYDRMFSHSVEIKMHNCKECQKPFKHRGSLANHFKACHSTVRSTCEACGKVFKRKSYLMDHTKTCRGHAQSDSGVSNNSVVREIPPGYTQVILLIRDVSTKLYLVFKDSE